MAKRNAPSLCVGLETWKTLILLLLLILEVFQANYHILCKNGPFTGPGGQGAWPQAVPRPLLWVVLAPGVGSSGFTRPPLPEALPTEHAL